MSEMDRNAENKPLRLTQTVKKGGCAAKLPAKDLRTVLEGFGASPPKELIVGMGDMDDAALWDLGNGLCQIHTTDFFTPIVDDPSDFGAIAATNALSDIYAMGGSPQTALCILGFPLDTLPLNILRPLMEGANRVIQDSGACLAGGHSIENPSLIFGFAITGTVEKEKVWTNSAAREGDVLILTKGLGTGTITSGLKIDQSKPEWVDAAVSSMTTLNRAVDLMEPFDIHAATDVTGFALAGHALQMAQASGKTFLIDMNRVPAIHGALESISNGVLNKAHRTNQLYAQDYVSYQNCSQSQIWLSVDPQTSGGLLLAIPSEQAEAAVTRLKTRFPFTATVGKVVAARDRSVEFRG